MNILTIPVFDLNCGSSVEVDLNYFVLYTGTESLSPRIVEVGKGINVQTLSNGKIVIQADTEFEGLSVLKLELYSEKIMLLFRIRKPEFVVFKFKPKQYVKDIAVAGEFNSWNPNIHKLEGPDNEGYYRISLDLPAGTYQYKFVIDGKRWVSDPENPQKLPDGFGGFNSVITVEGKKTGRFVPITKRKVNNKLCYSIKFVPEDNVKLDPSSIMVKINNVVLDKNSIRYNVQTQQLEFEVDIKDTGYYEISVNALTDEVKLVPEYYFCEYFGSKTFNWRDAVIYFVFTDRFYNGNISNDRPVADPEVAKVANYLGGDFAGVIKKIKDGYFSKLGVNTLWLSPVVRNPEKAYRDALPPHRKFTGYHGYWPVSLTETDPRFGTIEELQQLVSLAHHYGIKVIFDMVVNHVHEENIVYKQNPRWFTNLVLPDGRKNIRLFDERPYDTWFDEFLPSFDYENNPDAVDFMVENCLWWVEQTGCDGFRLDAVKHVPHCFWKKLRLQLRQKIELPKDEKFYLVGETISSREKIMEYVNPYELDGQFDFPLHWSIRDVFAFNTQDFTHLDKELKKSEMVYKNALMSIFLGNHDFARFASYASGDIKPNMNEKELAWTNPPKKVNNLGFKRLKLGFTFILTQSMIPMIYYGDEIGLAGAGDPDNRRMMQFDKLTRQQKSLFNFVSTLLKLREQHPALRYGIHHTLFVSKDVYVYAKKYFDETMVVVLNKSDKKVNIDIDLPEWLNIRSKLLKDVISSKKVKLYNNRKIKIIVPSMSSMIFCEG